MTRATARRPRPAGRSDLPIYIILAGMAALVVVALLILPGLSGSQPFVVPTPLPRPESRDNTLGNPNAPVRMEEFADFQCPVCGRFTVEIEPQLINDYVAPGKVFFVYRNFPVLGASSYRAAEASLCAVDQGSFWPYHDILFANQDETNPETFSQERLVRFAAAVGLEDGRLRECLSSGRHSAEVQADSQDATSLGMDATPSFWVNGQVVRGMGAYASFVDLIEGLLAGTPP